MRSPSSRKLQAQERVDRLSAASFLLTITSPIVLAGDERLARRRLSFLRKTALGDRDFKALSTPGGPSSPRRRHLAAASASTSALAPLLGPERRRGVSILFLSGQSAAASPMDALGVRRIRDPGVPRNAELATGDKASDAESSAASLSPGPLVPLGIAPLPASPPSGQPSPMMQLWPWAPASPPILAGSLARRSPSRPESGPLCDQ
mmetsp:Transcript_25449/g.70963  ORF Transcript_25449/g.70963 Transcript_25449/m.70963 type:complete len:206 (+) Transcript_25449:1250-1867(+)